jgi:hypothetical protein
MEDLRRNLTLLSKLASDAAGHRFRDERYVKLAHAAHGTDVFYLL